ncbi:hypothetical protein LTR67_011274 [Exophiala xenobiotica]
MSAAASLAARTASHSACWRSCSTCISAAVGASMLSKLFHVHFRDGRVNYEVPGFAIRRACRVAVRELGVMLVERRDVLVHEGRLHGQRVGSRAVEAVAVRGGRLRIVVALTGKVERAWEPGRVARVLTWSCERREELLGGMGMDIERLEELDETLDALETWVIGDDIVGLRRIGGGVINLPAQYFARFCVDRSYNQPTATSQAARSHDLHP